MTGKRKDWCILNSIVMLMWHPQISALAHFAYTNINFVLIKQEQQSKGVGDSATVDWILNHAKEEFRKGSIWKFLRKKGASLNQECVTGFLLTCHNIQFLSWFHHLYSVIKEDWLEASFSCQWSWNSLSLKHPWKELYDSNQTSLNERKHWELQLCVHGLQCWEPFPNLNFVWVMCWWLTKILTQQRAQTHQKLNKSPAAARWEKIIGLISRHHAIWIDNCTT